MTGGLVTCKSCLVPSVVTAGCGGRGVRVLMMVMVYLYDGEDEDGVLFHIVCARGQEGERERGREGRGKEGKRAGASVRKDGSWLSYPSSVLETGLMQTAALTGHHPFRNQVSCRVGGKSTALVPCHPMDAYES